VVTSIGPGALQALAASIVPASDGLGVWYLLGDETTEDEGYNMQQIPRHEQGLFHRLFSAMGSTYTLHTPLALSAALHQGASTVDHPFRAGPFFLLMPMNTQAFWLPDFNLDELPETKVFSLPAAAGDYETAATWLAQAEHIIVKVGGGARQAGRELQKFLEAVGGVLVHTPIATGCIPYSHPRNMTVGGSKGSIPGNYAMENADLLVAVGTRAVCQSDCSRTGYPNVRHVININACFNDASHYNKSISLVGDTGKTLDILTRIVSGKCAPKNDWLTSCAQKKEEWQRFKQERNKNQILMDEYWGGKVLTQPAAIKIVLDWARSRSNICFFDAGDVQANGFQIVEDEIPGQTITETGASYMGFAVSALLATGISSSPFYGVALTGDGSFTMNPQILIDGVEHGSHGCIVILDNGRMAAISGLQSDQYSAPFATWNTKQVDYAAMARAVPGVFALDGGRDPGSLKSALDQAGQHEGLSLIHVPVYFGPDPLGGMGVYGRWNVGDWCDEVQALRHKIGL
jgi:3D-(3,5/4)-trihydroxycyclohexane-1,2-dione acylhydrolase (decyclizing)